MVGSQPREGTKEEERAWAEAAAEGVEVVVAALVILHRFTRQLAGYTDTRYHYYGMAVDAMPTVRRVPTFVWRSPEDARGGPAAL